MNKRRHSNVLDRLVFERDLCRQGFSRVAGLDEAGRGPLAGPVTAAVVVLPKQWISGDWPLAWRGLNDSKQLTVEQREYFYSEIMTCPEIKVGVASIEAETIDRVNILEATYLAMRTALQQVVPAPDYLLVDGLPVPKLPGQQRAIVGGDARSYCIGAASVVAKVTRDRCMADYDRTWPEYGFAQHKGYGTKRHLEALHLHGPCPIHRRSFAPLRPRLIEQELF